ncbi:uncharacterized protein CTHT_0074470 [Thermochaetoides thermophila DSM 1495]|uniref:Maintenance of telomere capping protein 1 n=1 Tax=Chaetomium thermophilum (strain DSM 1495 / CBS 144.50 / IMI 039719) TaxID=759272 RepID=G0SI47_CHATD|nr:hypothetical protein CTHT_0074470 [Thermochaetoides thermophila DSM 1495]EGS17117.1 hypothetical protein CTHT_0074470 [Thermochaetoides thermophila DSM 1495]
MSKRAKDNKSAPTDDELGELFEGIGDDASIRKSSSSSTKPKTSRAKAVEDDILADLENQLGEAVADLPKRPHTPRVRDAAATKASPASKAARSQAQEEKKTPTPPLQTPVAEGASSQSQNATPEPQKKHSGGSWWGGLLSTATAAMKQAEAAVNAVKEIQQAEEAKKWAQQITGNVGALKGLGNELRHRALPTFTNILHTLAPPISSHERLLIHITHDLVGYPSLDPLIYSVFSRVMSQVEGGDLMVIQRGQESSHRSSSEHHKSSFFSQPPFGWRDGPWWRQDDSPRSIGIVPGLVEGTKLCRASAEAYAHEYFAANGGIEVARQRASEPLSESNPVRSSDIFLSVQAISVPSDGALFVGSAAAEKEKAASDVKEEQEDAEGGVCFAVYVFDPVHEIRYSTVSQTVPTRWIRWLDAPPAPASREEEGNEYEKEFGRLPEEIREIVETGGVDPREWVSEWVEEVLSLAVGIVAQRYVARRMGVGEGGIGKGKQKVEDVVQEGGNEAARAGLI